MLDSQRQQELTGLIQKLGLPPGGSLNWTLLDLALTHPTASSTANYEQLEFVGDSVVRMAVAELLFQRYPEWPVGEYAALRSILVSDRVLAQIATHYQLDRYLRVARSALNDQTGIESRNAEALEAVLGALYLSTHTLDLIHPWLDPHLEALIQEVRNDPARQNYKAALQEWTQAHYKALPEYRVEEMAGSHGDPNRFTAEVWFQAKLLGKGSGRSIKAAEQAAARIAFLAVQSQTLKPI
ncbi:MAG: ribonuclease III [Leptolyngbyaceae cyanobacterium bins.59]|nr:ribonuclease III [Leptolyngbyaceae cyanobacterium bins.59]